MTNKIRLSEENEITVHKRGNLIMVEEKEWARLRGLIDDLPNKSTGWNNWAFCILGLAGAFLIPALTVEIHRGKFFFISIALFAISGVLFLANHSLSKSRGVSKEKILQEMGLMHSEDK